VSERRTTGLSGLDAQLGGGLPPGTVHLLYGEPMNAFELFAYHFAAGGAAKGQGSRYLTTERTPEDVREGIRRVGGDPSKAEVVAMPHNGKWLIPDLKPGFRYILDDFTGYATAVGFDEALKRMVVLREQARKAEVELLVTLTSGLLDKSVETRMRLWADGVLELGFDRQGFGLYPFLKVTKMRGIPESSRFILFKETEAGLFMESTRRVF